MDSWEEGQMGNEEWMRKVSDMTGGSSAASPSHFAAACSYHIFVVCIDEV